MCTDKLVLGILAHVDAGKTTLAESILYKSGAIRKLGRVDHRDAFLDTHELERERGITIFSKQARFTLGNKEVCLLDTPGHVDFSAEMERVLNVLDYAVLLINGADGVQGHTLTLWRLLKRYNIPVFLFINKMDQQGTDKEKLLEQIQDSLDFRCIEFKNTDKWDRGFFEAAAMCDEQLMEVYLENSVIEKAAVINTIAARRIFPCYFGSALKQEGVDELLEGIEELTLCQKYGDEFAARVYKVSYDEQNNRLTHMKITGGSLKVKSLVSDSVGEWSEKADQIRLYSGSRYNTADEVSAGEICAVAGLGRTYAGEGLGSENALEMPVLEPVLEYQLVLPAECNVYDVYLKLHALAEEEPQLNILWEKALNEIHLQIMGEVQIEILKSLIKERFNIDVEFGAGNIVYKETIAAPSVGIGHYEPLRHYAEVHLLLEPLENGSGLEFAANCSEDVLGGNWQRLILTHLEERRHKGVLTGSEITDMRITLIAGRAHLKHTEGGDFRQAVYRAVRQGLKSAESILLEPYYDFRLEIPSDAVGRAMSDIQRKYGKLNPPVINKDTAIITGRAPVSTMRGYQNEVTAYSHGRGTLSCTLSGYEPCHNAEEVIADKGYSFESDIQNPAGSIFCAHGAGYYVEWDKVPEYAHVDNGINVRHSGENDLTSKVNDTKKQKSISEGYIAQEEIDEIFARTFGSIKQKRSGWSRTIKAGDDSRDSVLPKSPKYIDQNEYMLVDGYNIIFAWDELRELAEVNIDSARDKLMDIMCNYQGYKKNILILVFDAYKVAGGQGSVFDYHNIHIVYTKEAETADQYIEKVTHEIGKKHKVTVATSDRLEQIIVWGQGAKRLSAMGLKEEVDSINKEIREHLGKEQKNYLFDNISDDVVKTLDDIKK